MKPPFAGVDGCRAGWIAVLHGEAGPEMLVAADFAALLARMRPETMVAVDMPIGLPDRIGPGGRGPEAAVRRFLGERQSSVFSIPSRSAVFAEDYGEACRIALETSDPPRKVSRQAFHLFGKIREIDALLHTDAALAGRIFEAHPEFAFWRLNGGAAMRLPKKIGGRINPEGMAERRALLVSAGYREPFLGQASRGVGEDDVLDAAAVALIAGRRVDGLARPFPEDFERDAFGTPMAIWA